AGDHVVLTFRGDVRDTIEELARREAACCPFLDYRVETAGDAVVWTITNPRTGDDRAEADHTLDAFYELPASSSATSALTRSAISSRVDRT
ncbi:MAG TPA: hypothetical protein VFM58_21285, partial [Solirubrobacteraceae bacterium]|nr:hypothetical protein [Solirubrobacteraceae bacterium]